ncbi:MAG: MFS transporter [Candidatus Eiseniibacteriota bacterium]
MQKIEKHLTSPWLTLAILSSLGIIAMSAETMVLPAIPDIIHELGISYENSSWILASILVMGAVMTPIAGKLSDIYGKKRILLIILGAYIVGLFLGSIAFNFLTLITARSIQGIGISMFPIAFSILRDKFPPAKLAIAQGIFSSTLSGGAVIGLIIGGIIVGGFGWRATFLLIMPIAIILFLVIARFVRVGKEQQSVSNKASEFCCRFTHVRQDILLTENTTVLSISNDEMTTLGKSKSIDIKGALTLSFVIVSFLVTLQFLEKPLSFFDLIQIVLFSIASVVSLVVFVRIEQKTNFPLIDFRILKDKVILYANIINMTVGLTALMVVYQTLPILIRSHPPSGFGGDASSIANVQLPYMVVSLIFSVASGFLVSRFGNLRPTMVGTLVTTLGYFILLLNHSAETTIAAVLVIVAVGLALMQIGSVNVVLTSTPKQFSGISLGMDHLIYLIGSSVGPVIAGTYMQAHQVITNPSDRISTSYPSPESYSMIFLTATITSLASVIFAILLIRRTHRQGRGIKERKVLT